MMQPKKTKFRKAHKGRIHGTATSGATLSFGQYGLKAMAPERVTARQIEAARRALTRHLKRAGPRPRAPNRAPPPRADPSHEARRPRLDPRIPGRSGVEEARRSTHGL